MCKQISAEYVLGSILTFKSDGISLTDLKNFERIASKLENTYIMDISRSSVFNAIGNWSDYFDFTDDIIVLSDYYKSNIDRIRYLFFDTMDNAFQKIIIKAVKEMYM